MSILSFLFNPCVPCIRSLATEKCAIINIKNGPLHKKLLARLKRAVMALEAFPEIALCGNRIKLDVTVLTIATPLIVLRLFTVFNVWRKATLTQLHDLEDQRHCVRVTVHTVVLGHFMVAGRVRERQADH